MDILMVAAELSPYACATDAADAVAALAKSLRQLGHDVTLALPRYPGFEAAGMLLARRLTPLQLPGGGEVAVYDGQLASGAALVLFDAPVLFERASIFGEGGKDYPDNAKRFGLLCSAVAALVHQRVLEGRAFDILHLHDWPAAMLPAALKRLGGPEIPSVLTIHDGSLQGSFPTRQLEALGIAKEESDRFKVGTRVNALAGGIGMVDAVTTVSAAYLDQLMDPGEGGVLAERLRQLQTPPVGIVNGIDYSHWNPATDTLIPSRYDAEDASNKGRCKTDLLRSLELELDPALPLVVCVAPPTKEAGMDIVAAGLTHMLKNDLSIAILCTEPGRSGIVRRIQAAQKRAPEHCALVENADEALVHKAYAAADIVVVPHRHVPCGQSQRIAMRYGAAPVVHGVGGLQDTVVDCDAELETGTGFVFDAADSSSLMGALARALAAYGSAGWPKLRRRIMRQDLGWDRPSRRYLQVYRKTLGARA